MATLRVRDVMSRKVETADELEQVSAAALLARFRRFHHLPVIDGQRLVVGVLTPNDVLQTARGRHPVRVRDVMTSPPETIGELEPIEVAAERMTREGIHSLAVTSPGGQLLGIVTGTDLLRALAGEGAAAERLEDVLVDAVMTRDPVTVGADASIADAWMALVEADARHVPVVDADGRLVGILSDRDLRRHLGADPMRWGRAPSLLLEENVAGVMAENPTRLISGTRLGDAVGAFADERLSTVPVVDDRDRLVGVLSYVDVLRSLRDRAAPRPAASEPTEAWSIEPP